MAADITNATRTLTGNLAVIKVDGVAVGRMQDIRITENYNLGVVRGLGSLYIDDLPVLTWDGSLSCSFYTIDWDKTKIPKSVRRDTDNLKEFTDTILLSERGVSLTIYKKIKTGDNARGFALSDYEIIATVNNLYLNSEDMNITENQISGKNQSFLYKEPILVGQ